VFEPVSLLAFSGTNADPQQPIFSTSFTAKTTNADTAAAG
jgi:hypothetical protein